MADPFAPVASGIIPPDPNQGMRSLSQILGIQKQRQDLQTGQALQQSAQANAQQDQQAMGERQLLQNVMKNGVDDQGNSILNDQNEVDPKKMISFANRALPLTGQPIVQNILKTQSDKTNLSKSVADLSDKYKDDLSGITRSFINQPNAKAADVQAAYKTYAQQNPDAAPAVLNASSLVQHVDNAQGLKAKNDMLLHLSQQFQPASRTGEQQAPSVSTMQGPNGLQPVQMNPNAPGGVGTIGAPMPQGVAPQVTTSPQGNLGVIGSGGTMRPVTTPGQNGAPGAAPSKLQPLQRPNMNAPAADQARYNTQTAAATQHVQDVSAAANDPQNGTQVTRYRNNQIENILNSGNAQTGPNRELLNHIESSLTGGNSGTPYQTIGHYLAQNSAAVASKMGVPNTNMGSETAAAAAGNVRQNPDAIKEITKVNDGINTAFDYYNKGLAKATNNGSNTDKVPAFRQAFGQNFDMNLFRYEDAVRNGDKAEVDKIQKQLGPKGLAALGAKRRVIQSLANTGDLP